MRPIVTIEGIDQALSDLKYSNENSLKYRLVHTVRGYYREGLSIESLSGITSEDLVKALWDTGDDHDIIRNRKKNLNSIKSTVNADLKRLFKEGHNPEGIIINRKNVFDMSDEAKSQFLESFSGNVGEGNIPLGKIADVLKVVNDFLTEKDSNIEDDSKYEQLKELIKEISCKVGISDNGLPSGANSYGEHKEIYGYDPDKDLEEAEIDDATKDETEELLEDAEPEDEVAEIEDDEELEQVDIEDEPEDDIEEVLEDEETDDEVEELEDDEEFEEVDIEDEPEDENEEVLEEEGSDDEVEELEDDEEELEDVEVEDEPEDEIEEVLEEEGSDDEVEELEDDEEELEDVEVEEEPGDEIEEVFEDDEPEDEFEEIEGDEDLEEIEVEDESDDEIEEVLEDDEPENDLEEVLEDEETDNEVEELEDDEELEDVEVEEEPVDEIEEVLEDEEPEDEFEEIENDEELEEVEVEDESDDEIEEALEDDELEDELEELEDDEELEEIEVEDEPEEELEEVPEDDIKKANLLADEFDRSLSEMDRFYNQYILIPKGKYILGRVLSEEDEEEVIRIRLNGFYFGKFPVTNNLFEVFVERTGYITTAEKLGYGTVYTGRCQRFVDQKTGMANLNWSPSLTAEKVEGACWYQPNGPDSNLHGKRNHPVVQVSFKDAASFASWTGKQLPSEIEWEAATRTSKGYDCPWGNRFRGNCCNIESSYTGDTTPVDKYNKNINRYGIADALGNVLEWTRDKTEIKSGGNSKNFEYIVKGGSWVSNDQERLYQRTSLDPVHTSNILGFRCVAY